MQFIDCFYLETCKKDFYFNLGDILCQLNFILQLVCQTINCLYMSRIFLILLGFSPSLVVCHGHVFYCDTTNSTLKELCLFLHSLCAKHSNDPFLVS